GFALSGSRFAPPGAWRIHPSSARRGMRSLGLRSQAFGDFDLSAPGVRDVYDPETRCVCAVANRRVGFDAGGLKLRHNRVDVPDLEAHVIDRPAFCRGLSLVDLIKGNLRAWNISGLKLSTLASGRAEVLDVPLLSRDWIGHPQVDVMHRHRRRE